MSSLFLVGNTNPFTFANAVLAADTSSKELEKKGLSKVFVLHSPESEIALCSNTEWKNHLLANGINTEIFIYYTADLQNGGPESLKMVANHCESFLLGMRKSDNIYVDLTNGNSLYKSILSNIAYVLGVKKQFILKTSTAKGFLDRDALAEAYVELPDPSILDSVAPAWLTEVRRFNINARRASEIMSNICGASSERKICFEDDIHNAIRSWFSGEKNNSGSELGGAVRYIGRAFEDIMHGANELIYTNAEHKSQNLYKMISRICAHLNEVAPQYEPNLLEDVAQLLRKLRNVSTHEPTSPEFGRIRARLSTELLLATSEYISILNSYGYLKKSIQEVPQQCKIEGEQGEEYFFGLDGDDTGRELEGLFQSNHDAEGISRFSNQIESAIKSVKDKVASPPISGKVLFASGDDILFFGQYDKERLAQIKSHYLRISGGRSCCIGYGKTPKEAYVALKMAKATPGKDTIIGIEVMR